MEKHTLNGENDKATFVGKSFREAKTFADETISIIRSLLNDDSFKNERSLLTSGHSLEILFAGAGLQPAP